MVSISLPITKCSVTHNKVMNIQDFLEYMLKSSKCGRHASKMKSWILYRLRSTQKYPHFEDFFIDQRWLKFRIFYHISTPYVIIYVIKPAEGYSLFTLGSRGFSCMVSGFGHVWKWPARKASGPERHPFDSPEPVRTPLIPKHPESGCFAHWFLGDIECFICSDWITITIGACSGRGWLIACVASVSNRVIARKFLLSPPPPPPPSFLFFFLPSSQLSRLTRAETLATQASWLKVTV